MFASNGGTNMKKLFLILTLALMALTTFVSCQKDPNTPCVNGDHDWKLINKVAPTCTEEGVNTYECTRCGQKKTEALAIVEHTLTEGSRICSICNRAIYKSLEDFNQNATLENTKDVINEITLREHTFTDIAYSEHNSGYTGKGLLIGRTDNDPLNKYGTQPAESGKYKFIFKNGTVNSTTTGYENIDNLAKTAVYMLIPGNSEVTFENVTFNEVFSFGIQAYTSPWSHLESLTFKNCTFNGIIIGSSPAKDITFEGCTFTNYINNTDANNSNPIWMRPRMDSWSGEYPKHLVSMQNIVFKDNKVSSTRPVKFEWIGMNNQALGYQPVLTILNNSFVMSRENSANKDNEDKAVALYLGQKDDNSKFTLYDDGNKVNEGYALYTTQNPYRKVEGTYILDKDGNEKEIVAKVWKSQNETFIIKTIPTTTP